MRHEPDGQYKWILHAKDHFSKLSCLWVFKSKHVKPVAEVLEQWIMSYRPPSIIQCDNGLEFKGALLLLLCKYSIQRVNGNSRSPQTQGLVEQGNGVVKHKLRAWKMKNNSVRWWDALLEVTLQINTLVHSVTRRASYDIVFRHWLQNKTWLTARE